ncbi:PUM-HD domain-containing protein [Caenorhabditis elegans]|uniref:PUM-HD domain-containing protein n=1 Tax=Caenorhabditis elegans TaxID=6239 RepID=G5EBX2_CAEEL|nr:PUM-HD domain-containing protein [Caenorhabditis elegans]CAB00127.4 PUM-HD domain-containing protein [Caenorhabditis elegans]|eukprot:NP_001256397.1 Uncharacterized protein CELE_R07B7.2 [Caenorhabditis elegans]
MSASDGDNTEQTGRRRSFGNLFGSTRVPFSSLSDIYANQSTFAKDQGVQSEVDVADAWSQHHAPTRDQYVQSEIITAVETSSQYEVQTKDKEVEAICSTANRTTQTCHATNIAGTNSESCLIEKLANSLLEHLQARRPIKARTAFPIYLQQPEQLQLLPPPDQQSAPVPPSHPLQNSEARQEDLEQTEMPQASQQIGINETSLNDADSQSFFHSRLHQTEQREETNSNSMQSIHSQVNPPASQETMESHFPEMINSQRCSSFPTRHDGSSHFARSSSGLLGSMSSQQQRSQFPVPQEEGNQAEDMRGAQQPHNARNLFGGVGGMFPSMPNSSGGQGPDWQNNHFIRPFGQPAAGMMSWHPGMMPSHMNNSAAPSSFFESPFMPPYDVFMQQQMLLHSQYAAWEQQRNHAMMYQNAQNQNSANVNPSFADIPSAAPISQPEVNVNENQIVPEETERLEADLEIENTVDAIIGNKNVGSVNQAVSGVNSIARETEEINNQDVRNETPVEDFGSIISAISITENRNESPMPSASETDDTSPHTSRSRYGSSVAISTGMKRARLEPSQSPPGSSRKNSRNETTKKNSKTPSSTIDKEPTSSKRTRKAPARYEAEWNAEQGGDTRRAKRWSKDFYKAPSKK